MATLLLKKSYQLSNLKEVTFKDLWGSKGVFTTMRMIGKPPKLLLIKPHIENLLKSTKKYGIKKKNLKNIITNLIEKVITLSKLNTGLINISIMHTSASLLIQENADTNVQKDLLNFFDKIAPMNENLYIHNDEGKDDMPAHIKSALTQTNLSLSFGNKKLKYILDYPQLIQENKHLH